LPEAFHECATGQPLYLEPQYTPSLLGAVLGRGQPWGQRVKAPAGLGKLVLYLDYDGVLHHENVLWHPRKGVYLQAPGRYVLFQHAALLETVLAPYPEVRIVLSTSWVRRYAYSRTVKRLPQGLQQRCVGATFHEEMRHFEEAFADTPRGLQILRDVQRRQPRDWLAVDDDLIGWPEAHLHKVVQTDPYEGISAPTVLDELRSKLAAMCAGSA
jgi:hypothetical protein